MRARSRIIPARAGFTTDGSPGGHPDRDHPRSRGVYTKISLPETVISGSSPLARGLRDGSDLPAGTVGIIPARAGFTGVVHILAFSPGDHPRSRGVYTDTYDQQFTALGSSPLARGLHEVSFQGDRGQADHPRSRGVYNAAFQDACQRSGSSPLARGLL